MSLLALLVLPASAGELTLTEALAQVPAVRSVRTAQTLLDTADAGLLQAQAAFDPRMSVTSEATGSSTSGYIAGYPMDSTSSGTQSGIALTGTLPTATTWAVDTSLSYTSTTTTSQLGDVASEQVRKNWAGLVSLSVTQDVLAPLRTSSTAIQRRQARESADVAELEARQAVEEAVETVAARWWTWSAAHRQADVADRALEEVERLLVETRARAEEGELADLEVTRVETQHLQARRAALAAEADARQAGDALATLLGLPHDPDRVPGGPGAIAAGGIAVGAAESMALANDLGVAIARSELQASQAGARDARAVALPTLDLTGSVGVASLTEGASTAISALATDPLPRWAVGMQLGVQLGGRAARGSIDSARAAVTRAVLALEQAEDDVRLAVRVALDDVELSRSAVELAAAELQVAKATEAGEQARLDEGLTRLDDLLSARDDRMAAEVSLVDAEADRARAELALLRHLGRISELAGLEVTP